MALMLDTAATAALAGEQELIAAARAGDDRAFEELYARYSERIHAFIFGRIHDHGRAEDIAQEVFMAALRRLRTSDQEIAFKPWIYEIAKNACIDEYRRSRRTREVSLDADEELVNGRRALLSLAENPAVAAENRQRLNDLRGAFGGLTESHHKLLVMRELEGLSYTEIARRTGMSRQMVESTLFRARRKLAEEYDELASGRRCLNVQTLIEGGRALSARTLGIRERRRLARHLAHCQPCRVKAHLAGVDESLLRPSSIADKIAALLPFGIWKWLWRGGSRGSHPVALQSVQAASSLPDPAGTTSSLGGAAVAAAVIALAGAAGAIVSSQTSSEHALRTPAVLAPTAHRNGSTSAGSKHGRAAPGGNATSARRSTPLRARPSRSRPSSTGTGARTGAGPGGSGSASGGRSAKPGRSSSSAATNPVSTATNTAGSTANRAGSTVHKVVNTVKTTARQTGKALSQTASSVSNTVSSMTSSLGKTISGAGSAAGKTVSSTTSSLGKTVSGAGSSLGKTVSSAGSSLGNTVSNTGAAVSKTIDGTDSSITSPPPSSSTGKPAAGTASALGSTVKQVGSTVSKLLP
jgi:RNA polymerase sigma factor (sigma-70 family)